MPKSSEKIRRFILTSVPTVPHLEAILLLRSAPFEPWNASRVARRLYIPEAQAAVLLAALKEAGIARCDSERQFVYAAAGELAVLLDAVAEAYATDLLGVTQLIHSRIDRRAHQFADAFRIK